VLDLKGKKILFIGTGFFDYEDEIKKKLEKYGAKVSYFNTCYYDYVARIYLKLGFKKKALFHLQKNRIRMLLSITKDNDIVFVIKGENLTQIDFDLLHQFNSKANFILYLWDSLARIDNKELLLSNFNKIWSFDRIDCLNNRKLNFRPLFYRYIPKNEHKIYLLSFIGSMHSDRLDIVRSLRDKMKFYNETYYFKIYMRKFYFLISRYLTHKIKKTDMEFIILKNISYSEFQRITAKSIAVLDISHPLQSGLTMRAIETLAAGCHLLTTNSDIINYPQIPETGYTIFSRDNPVLPNIKKMENSMMSEYFSLDHFINELFA